MIHPPASSPRYANDEKVSPFSPPEALVSQLPRSIEENHDNIENVVNNGGNNDEDKGYDSEADSVVEMDIIDGNNDNIRSPIQNPIKLRTTQQISKQHDIFLSQSINGKPAGNGGGVMESERNRNRSVSHLELLLL